MGSGFWLVSRLLRLLDGSVELAMEEGRGVSCEDGEPGPRPCGSLPHWSSLGSLSLSRPFWNSGFTLSLAGFTVGFLLLRIIKDKLQEAM